MKWGYETPEHHFNKKKKNNNHHESLLKETIISHLVNHNPVNLLLLYFIFNTVFPKGPITKINYVVQTLILEDNNYITRKTRNGVEKI
jgi:hypothetical protein